MYIVSHTTKPYLIFFPKSPKYMHYKSLCRPCLIDDQPNKKVLASCILHAPVLNKTNESPSTMSPLTKLNNKGEVVIVKRN